MQRQAYILLLLTTLFWGGNSVAGKLAVGHVSPMLLTNLRWGLACLCLLALGHARLRADWTVVSARLPFLFGLAFLGFTLFNVAAYSAVVHTSAINVSIEQAGIPMLIFILNFLFFRIRVSVGQIVGFSLSLVGVALTAGHGSLASLLNLQVNVGDAIMLVALVVYAIYTVALRFRPAVHWQSFMIVLTGAAFLTSLPFALAEHATGAMIWPDARGWAVVAYTVLFPSLLSQVFYVRGVELIGANRAGLFINLVPIFGTLLAILILREAFHAYHAVALMLALAEWSGRRMAARDGA